MQQRLVTRTDPQGFSDLPLRRITRPTSPLPTPVAVYHPVHTFLFLCRANRGDVAVWNSKFAHEFETSRVFRLYAKYLSRALIRPVVVVIRNLLIPPSLSSAPFELVPTGPDPFSPLVWIRRTGILRASNSWQGSRREFRSRENGVMDGDLCGRVHARECLSSVSR